MVSIVKSMILQGLDGILIHVEVDVSSGMPSWEIVGLPDTSVRESKERVKSAIKNSGYEILSRKYIINLSPADVRKEGAKLDLSIAIGVLSAMEVICLDNFQDTIFIGELSLDGKINKVNGVLPICIEAMKNNIKKVIVPKENLKEAQLIKEIKAVGITDLNELIKYINGEISFNYETVNIKSIIEDDAEYEIDFLDVKGQNSIKRALEVAAAGGHNCLMIGSPGSGKTMMARRIPTILPDLTFEESLEITKIHSIAGLLENNGLVTKRPFRSPHHTISPNGIIGGGKVPKPGEISLSHYGVLFLDELPEFNRNTLEVLRGPLEDRKVTITRVSATVTYPCNFMLVVSLNPCPCGYFGNKEKECTCTIKEREKYLNKISGPLLDRIDIQVEVPSVKYNELSGNKGESSKEIKKRVNEARNIQLQRYKEYGIYSNSELTPKLIEKFCSLEESTKVIFNSYFEKMNFSARAYSRILKVARTIADLDGSEKIQTNHILEAIGYRSLDKNNEL